MKRKNELSFVCSMGSMRSLASVRFSDLMRSLGPLGSVSSSGSVGSVSSSGSVGSVSSVVSTGFLGSLGSVSYVGSSRVQNSRNSVTSHPC